MQRILKWAATGLLALLCFIPTPVRAADGSAAPVVIISLASLDELIGDIEYLTEAAGKGDFGEMVALLAGPYTEGIDRTRPSGAFATLDGIEPKVLGFLPITDLDALFGVLEEQLGKPEDAGDGVFEFLAPNGMSIYIKESHGWAFIGRTARDVTDVEGVKPLEILGDLPQLYDVCLRLHLNHLPPEIKQFASRQLSSGFEQQLQLNLEAENDEEGRLVAEKIARSMMTSIQSAINDTDQLTLGWNVDAEASKTYLEYSVTALPDTALAKKLSLADGNTSQFGGFVIEDAALSFQVTTRADKEAIAHAMTFLGVVREKATQEIAKDEDLPDDASREFATSILNDLMDVIEQTAQAGKPDLAGAVVLMPGATNVLLGGAVADGYAIESILGRIADVAENDPGFPAVEKNIAEHGDVRFHRISVPIPAGEEDARQMFGEKLEIVFGAGKESIYVAIGPSGVDRLKEAIDKSKAMSAETISPLTLRIALEQALNFAASVKKEPVLAMMAATLKISDGKDHILISSQAIERGVRYRIELEAGILRLGAAAVDMRGGFGGF